MTERLSKRLIPPRKIIVFALASAFLITSGTSAVCSAARNVSISDGEGIDRSLITFETQVGKLLEKEGISLKRGDKMNVSRKQRVENNMTIEIYRAISVNITVNGETKKYLTTKRTATEILSEVGFSPDGDDIILPAPDAEIEYGGAIDYTDVSFEYLTENEEIPYETVEELSGEMTAGERSTVQEGVSGELAVTYLIRYENGAEVSRERVSEEVVREPQNKIVYVGAKISPAFASGATTDVSRGEISRVDLTKCRSIIAEATAYDNSFESVGKSPGDSDYGITASGMPCGVGVIAVDPGVIPLGTRLYVEATDGSWSYGYCIAGDTGGAIKGNRIDLFFNTASECRNFGRRSARVYIIE